jgi:hypothetical protein
MLVRLAMISFSFLVAGEGGLAGLPWTEQGDDRMSPNEIAQSAHRPHAFHA